MNYSTSPDFSHVAKLTTAKELKKARRKPRYYGAKIREQRILNFLASREETILSHFDRAGITDEEDRAELLQDLYCNFSENYWSYSHYPHMDVGPYKWLMRSLKPLIEAYLERKAFESGQTELSDSDWASFEQKARFLDVTETPEFLLLEKELRQQYLTALSDTLEPGPEELINVFHFETGAASLADSDKEKAMETKETIKQRKAFELRMDGLSTKEIGEEMNTTWWQASDIFRQASRKLNYRLMDDFGTEARWLRY